ncbi:MAG: diguanylate cyclase [Nitrosomonas sp.]|nr:diguanylate cyclase [Nitrosomonas sp.]
MLKNLKDSSPSTIAREALQRLAALKIPPTPDNYQKIYDEITGNGNDLMCANAKKLLSELATEIPRSSQELINFSNTLARAIRDHDWEKYKLTLLSRVIPPNDKIGSSVRKTPQNTGIPWNKTIELLLKQLDANHGNLLDTARKWEELQHVLSRFSNDPAELQDKIHTLIDSWKILATDAGGKIEVLVQDNADPSITPAESTGTVDKALNPVHSPQNSILQRQFMGQLPELLAHILEHVATMPLADPAFTKETNDLAQEIRRVQSKQKMEHFINDYTQYLEKFEFSIEDSTKLQRGLLRLLHKLIESTRQLLTEDEWVKDQIAKLHETMSRPLSQRSIAQAESQLEEILQRQNAIKRNLSDSREILKQMITGLIGNIEALSDETGDFNDKIKDCANRINQTEDLQALNELHVEIMNETRKMQEKAQHYRSGFIAARAEVEAAQEKINQLESELQHISEKIHEDHLTGVLNRRGLDFAFEREIARAKRLQQPLCYALLDIDNFKKLNDTHGHKVGDDAIRFLIASIKTATRADDIVARYGGEEFVVLLPDTNLKTAIEIISRVRRNLTRHYFLHENNRLLITFSAGIAECGDHETQEAVFKRADAALYRAKKSGKNLILEAV